MCWVGIALLLTAGAVLAQSKVFVQNGLSGYRVTGSVAICTNEPIGPAGCRGFVARGNTSQRGALLYWSISALGASPPPANLGTVSIQSASGASGVTLGTTPFAGGDLGVTSAAITQFIAANSSTAIIYAYGTFQSSPVTINLLTSVGQVSVQLTQADQGLTSTTISTTGTNPGELLPFAALPTAGSSVTTGQTLSLTFLLRSASSTPISGQPVSAFITGNSSPFSGTTNAQGQVQFNIPVVATTNMFVSVRATHAFSGGSLDASVFFPFVASSATTRQVTALTPAADNASVSPKSDASGRYIVFQSAASNLLGSGMDSNGSSDIFRIDRTTGAALRLSVNTDGSQVAGESLEPSVSADGNFAVFVAPNAVMTKLWGEPKSVTAKYQKQGGFGVFLRNLLSNTTQRVGQGLNSGSGTRPVIAPDGQTVIFTGTNSDPALGAVGQDNVFRRGFNRSGDALMPVAPDPDCVSCKSRSVMGAAVGNADGPSRNATVSADGRFVVYQTVAKNVIDGTTT